MFTVYMCLDGINVGTTHVMQYFLDDKGCESVIYLWSLFIVMIDKKIIYF